MPREDDHQFFDTMVEARQSRSPSGPHPPYVESAKDKALSDAILGITPLYRQRMREAEAKYAQKEAKKLIEAKKEKKHLKKQRQKEKKREEKAAQEDRLGESTAAGEKLGPGDGDIKNTSEQEEDDLLRVFL